MMNRSILLCHQLLSLERVSLITIGLNDLELYGRWQTVRLNNVRLEDEAKCE